MTGKYFLRLLLNMDILFMQIVTLFNQAELVRTSFKWNVFLLFRTCYKRARAGFHRPLLPTHAFGNARDPGDFEISHSL